jgi:hypothetical protein
MAGIPEKINKNISANKMHVDSGTAIRFVSKNKLGN